MPGVRISDEIRERFHYLHFSAEGPKISTEAAGKALGISNASAYRLANGSRQSPKVDREARSAEMPDPIALADLSQFALDCLADFDLFSEAFLARRPTPWRRRAAMVICEALNDTSERTFVDMNVFPGSGKSTLLHDVKAWLIAGGDFDEPDPQRGRAIRIMQGSFGMSVATNEVKRLRRILDLKRPYYYQQESRYATHVLQREYGRFKPDTSKDEESIWAADEFLVAQMGEVEIYEKEPTVQAASRKSGFLGDRALLGIWDDLANSQNSKSPEVGRASCRERVYACV